MTDLEKPLNDDFVTIDAKENDDDARTSVDMFLQRNTDRELIEAQRDAVCGPMKWLSAAIFGFLLFSPVLPIIPKMDSPWVVAVLWVMIALILWTYLEYAARAEVWYICICRGIIVDFHKTDSLGKWLCQKPMYFAYIFLVVYVLVTYYGLDPHLELNDTENFTTAGLGILGLLFVIFMTKSVVDLEGSNWLLSVNLLTTYFRSPDMLQSRGFKTVHLTQLKKFSVKSGLSVGGLAGKLTGGTSEKTDDSFSWNQIHELSNKADESVSFSLVDGFRIAAFLRPHRNLME